MQPKTPAQYVLYHSGADNRNRLLAMLVLLLASTLFVAACSSSSDTSTPNPPTNTGNTNGDNSNKTEPTNNGNTSSDPDNGNVSDSSGRESNREVALVARQLTRFDECDALLRYIRSEAVDRVGDLQGFAERSLYRVHGIFGSTVPVPGWELVPARRLRESFSTGSLSSLSDSGSAEPVDRFIPPRAPLAEDVDYSGTNVQEIAVDEPDVVKTDGRKIFVVSAGRLSVIDATTREMLGDVKLTASQNDGEIGLAPAYYQGIHEPIEPLKSISNDKDVELFLDGDSLLVISWDYSYAAHYALRLRNPETLIERVDLNAAGKPEIVQTVRVQGSYVNARSVDGVARIIIRSQPQQNLPFVQPDYSQENTESATQETNEQVVLENDTAVTVVAPPSRAQEINEQVVLESTLEDWLPTYELTSPDGSETEGLLPSCDQVHVPAEFSGFGTTTLLNVPVAGTINPTAATTVFAPSEIVYASPESLYVATTQWLDDITLSESEENPEEEHSTTTTAETNNTNNTETEVIESTLDETLPTWQLQLSTNIHRFDITDPAKAVYTASGDVPGTIHNQFSLSEHNGHLRVVTTSVTIGSSSIQSESWVRVLDEVDGQLVEVGAVGDIGKGEQVQSVQFVGDIGYVVTVPFRTKIDPFYTVDLSDPTNPTVVGELKIPGFSSYLHPISDTLILGIGEDADENGRVTGSKVSLFDVSDLAAPQEVDVWSTPDSWNDIGWEHRAFLWWAPENLAIIPFNAMILPSNTLLREPLDGPHTGVIVLRVDDNALVEVGRVVHDEHLQNQVEQSSCRLIVAEDVLNSHEIVETPPPRFGTSSVDEIFWFILYRQNEPHYFLRLMSCEPDEEPDIPNVAQGVISNVTQEVPPLGCRPIELTEDEEATVRQRLALEASDRLWVCYQNLFREIVRSFVIADELWTLSYPYTTWETHYPHYLEGEFQLELVPPELLHLQNWVDFVLVGSGVQTKALLQVNDLIDLDSIDSVRP